MRVRLVLTVTTKAAPLVRTPVAKILAPSATETTTQDDKVVPRRHSL